MGEAGLIGSCEVFGVCHNSSGSFFKVLGSGWHFAKMTGLSVSTSVEPQL